jgi:ADP-heptose:LPS heptosyltransferase
MRPDVRLDCRHYLGDRPCVWRRDCTECDTYSPAGTRVLVIKLAAPGDVLRATAILPPLRRKYPESLVTWVTDEAAAPLVARNPYVDRVMSFAFDTALIVAAQSFDVAICLDKEPRAGALMRSVRSERKLGFELSDFGTIRALNEGAAYDLALGLSDDLKFRGNTRSYPDIACGVAELPYEGDPYVLALSDDSVERARSFLSGLAPREPVVGLVAGAGAVFANKAWPPHRLADLARAVRGELGGTAIVLGGGRDRSRMEEVLRLAGGAALDGGTHDLLDYAALVGLCDAVVTGDTMALHVAIALGVPVVALFGPTVPQEIELFGRGRKIASRLECAPCYRRSCERSPSCMDAVPVEDVLAALREALGDA